ncbi:MAG TPA: NUDIX domain-containing protein [Pseudonocardiaceae bacterium]|nr:NUDIX domain-containing protein [Pseudonocardiaceae bacterium]
MDPHSLVVLLVVVLGAALVFGPWLLGTANRLDRLHVRTDAAWAGLDAALARRAVVTRALAATGAVSPSRATALRDAADRAELAGRDDREAAESELSRLLGDLDRSVVPAAMAAELADAEQRVVLARRVHNDAVRDTLALRTRRLVRWLRLAGTAARPNYFEIAEPDPDLALAATSWRRSARIVLADPAGRVLLRHGDGEFWYPPGGGVEDGEDLRVTAVRELKEETGLSAAPDRLVGPAWRRRVSVPTPEGTRHSEEWFFLARTGQGGTVDGHRWWTQRELRSTSERIYPEQLAEYLPTLLDGTWDGTTRPIR